jgi:hypothetical protein
MQETQQLIGILHVPNPSIPSSVFQSISKASQHEDDGEDRIWRMNASNDICNDLARGSDDRNS